MTYRTDDPDDLSEEMSEEMSEEIFAKVASQVVRLGNQTADENGDASLPQIADGLLAGAIQFWLFAHQPCDDPDCRDCAAVSTARRRMQLLGELVQELAEQSEYYHSPNDADVGRA